MHCLSSRPCPPRALLAAANFCSPSLLPQPSHFKEVRPRTPFESKFARPNARIRTGEPVMLAMVARGDLGAELPIEEVPLLQEEIIRICRSMGKAVIVATNMLESMIVHPTPTRAEVSDIAIAVREGSDAIMLSGETAHGKYPLKAVKVMHTVALRTEATLNGGEAPANLGQAFQSHMSEMFAFHATMISNTLGTSIVVFTRSGFMAILLSHYRPSGTIFAFTDDERVRQRLALYQGVCPLHMKFSDDADTTFAEALSLLQKLGMVKEGEQVALVQSGRKPIWRSQTTHNIQVRKV